MYIFDTIINNVRGADARSAADAAGAGGLGGVTHTSAIAADGGGVKSGDCVSSSGAAVPDEGVGMLAPSLREGPLAS